MEPGGCLPDILDVQTLFLLQRLEALFSNISSETMI